MASTRPQLKVILCGEYGVGKSSLFRRFVTDDYLDTNDRRSTLGFDHFEKPYKVEGKDFAIQLWDTGGLERVASMTRQYFKFAQAAILVFSHDDTHSLNMLSQHMLEIIESAEGATIFLCGNKVDLSSDSNADAPTDAMIQAFRDEFRLSAGDNMIHSLFSTSCKTGAGVHEMFGEIAKTLAVTSRVLRPSPSESQQLSEVFRLRKQSLTSSGGGCCGGGSNEQELTD